MKKKYIMENDWGMKFFHHNMKPIIWFQQGNIIQWSYIENHDMFHKVYGIRFKDMDVFHFQVLFGDSIQTKELKI